MKRVKPKTESNWVYFKIYCGPYMSNRVLLKLLAPALRKAFVRSHSDIWFFVRYFDPYFHIRFRIHVKEEGKLQTMRKIMMHEFSEFLESGMIRKAEEDVYKPELERYQDKMDVCERIFHIDSCLQIELLKSLVEKDAFKWMYFLPILKAYLEVFLSKKEEQLLFMEKLVEAYRKEFSLSKVWRIKIDKKYRVYLDQINHFMEEGYEADLLMEIESFKKKLEQVVPERRLPDTVLRDVIHMSADRFYAEYLRLHELIIYSFYTKYLSSKISRVTYFGS